MRTIEIKPGVINQALNKAPFILLGAEEAIDSDLLKDVVIQKIHDKTINEQVPGFWGTLGMADD